MGIAVEFNPDLALRHFRHYRSGQRSLEECLPEPLEAGRIYDFLKEGQRNYWLLGEQPLLETKGNQQLSPPLASIIIFEATHFLRDGKVFTRGRYLIKEVYPVTYANIHFNGFAKVK